MIASNGAELIEHPFVGVPTVFPAGRNLLMTTMNVVGSDAKLRLSGPAMDEIQARPGFLREVRTEVVRLLPC